MSELLAPAGSMEALVAAVQNGADAVYFGARLFNARRGADNFDEGGLQQAVSYCHARGVRAHVTLNTLVREDEMAALEEQIAEIAAAGADAVIVQDLGVAACVRRLAPRLSLHASTQMAVHNRQGVEYLRAHGFDRAVLAREMPLVEIEKCAGLGVELEAFCHGALCVSCSGQCLFSSLVGGRSGNRGMCAQPCRLPYRLGETRGYLLSPRDLMLLDGLQAMQRAGVVSFKIEGRLKRPEYVAVVTGIYRRALDGEAITQADREALLQIFNRGGFSRGYLRDMNDAALMYPERPNHMGVLVGENGVLRRDVDAEDMLVERAGGQERPLKLQGRAGTRIAARGKIYRLTDAGQMRAARESYAQERRTAHLTAHLVMRPGERMRLRISDGTHAFEAVGENVQTARTKPLDEARVRAQIDKTGGTPYVFTDIALDMDRAAFASAAQLNALRRAALDGLTNLRVASMSAPERAAQIGATAEAPFPASDGMGKPEAPLAAGSNEGQGGGAPQTLPTRSADGVGSSFAHTSAPSQALEGSGPKASTPTLRDGESAPFANSQAHADLNGFPMLSPVRAADVPCPRETIGVDGNAVPAIHSPLHTGGGRCVALSSDQGGASQSPWASAADLSAPSFPAEAQASAEAENAFTRPGVPSPLHTGGGRCAALSSDQGGVSQSPWASAADLSAPSFPAEAQASAEAENAFTRPGVPSPLHTGGGRCAALSSDQGGVSQSPWASAADLSAPSFPAEAKNAFEAQFDASSPLQRPEAAHVRLIARSDRPDLLLAALKDGADEIVFDPADLRQSALNATLQALNGQPFSLALPQTANADVLDGLHGWVRTLGRQLTSVYASNVAHLAMDWGAEVRGDFGLNLFSARAVAATGIRRYMPSLELTSRQLAALPGEKELFFWGRAPLMRLRHCPLRAAKRLSGPHDRCRRCDHDEKPVDGLALIDRKGAAFPLRRIASDGGCVVEVLNSVPHWLLPKRERLCSCSGWVLFLRAGEPAAAIVRACRTALADGEVDLASLAGLQTTSGHYFRGVE